MIWLQAFVAAPGDMTVVRGNERLQPNQPVAVSNPTAATATGAATVAESATATGAATVAESATATGAATPASSTLPASATAAAAATDESPPTESTQ